mgnify:CR=1 FL=1
MAPAQEVQGTEGAPPPARLIGRLPASAPPQRAPSASQAAAAIAQHKLRSIKARRQYQKWSTERQERLRKEAEERAKKEAEERARREAEAAITDARERVADARAVEAAAALSVSDAKATAENAQAQAREQLGALDQKLRSISHTSVQFEEAVREIRGESAWGAPFKDECHGRLRFTHRGLLGMASSGPNTNGSQFFMTLANCEWLDNKPVSYTHLTLPTKA